MDDIRRKVTSTILLLFLLFSAACASESDVDEKLFKETCEKLRDLIELMEKVPSHEKKIIYKDKIELHVSTAESENFVRKTEGQWLAVIENLEKIKVDLKSKWSDDAAFCTVIAYLYMCPSPKFNRYAEYLLRQYDDFTKKYQGFKIEPWTKRTLKTVFDTLGYTIPGEFPKSISKEEIIENKLKMIVALKLQICGKSSEATVLYEELAQKYPGTLIAEQALGQIKLIREEVK